MEIWKDIIGYEGQYQISNYGRVKSTFRSGFIGRNTLGIARRERILTPSINNSGYSIIVLKKKCYSVHRLVAIAFIPNPNNYTDINHKDENKLNNSVDNLEWMTHKDNMNYGTARERISANQRKPIHMRTKTIHHHSIFIEETNECLGTPAEASVLLGITQGRISQLIKQQRPIKKGLYKGLHLISKRYDEKFIIYKNNN